MSDASSTRMISLSRCLGDRSMTECTVRSRIDQASLWKQMITLVVGRFVRNRPGALHLHGQNQQNEMCIYLLKLYMKSCVW